MAEGEAGFAGNHAPLPNLSHIPESTVPSALSSGKAPVPPLQEPEAEGGPTAVGSRLTRACAWGGRVPTAHKPNPQPVSDRPGWTSSLGAGSLTVGQSLQGLRARREPGDSTAPITGRTKPTLPNTAPHPAPAFPIMPKTSRQLDSLLKRPHSSHMQAPPHVHGQAHPLPCLALHRLLNSMAPPDEACKPLKFCVVLGVSFWGERQKCLLAPTGHRPRCRPVPQTPRQGQHDVRPRHSDHLTAAPRALQPLLHTMPSPETKLPSACWLLMME